MAARRERGRTARANGRGPRSSRWVAWLLLCSLTTPLAACLGTAVEAPPPSEPGPAYQTLRWHLLAAPTLIRADACQNGLAQFTTYVPPWGLAIGILSFGIVVPQWTVLACVADEGK